MVGPRDVTGGLCQPPGRIDREKKKPKEEPTFGEVIFEEGESGFWPGKVSTNTKSCGEIWTNLEAAAGT